MNITPQEALERCDTLMLDMDGTILDLAFDNYVWLDLVPRRYAAANNMTHEEARTRLMEKYRSVQGDLSWYCLDHWNDRLGIDVVKIHHDVTYRIAYLPGALEFLRKLRELDKRVLLVTNSHPDTLELKNDTLGFAGFFDGIHSSHTYGHAKEKQEFWHALQEEEGFDPATTVFVDDTVPVLRSALEYGITQSVVITEPDTTEPPRENGEFPGVPGVRELV